MKVCKSQSKIGSMKFMCSYTDILVFCCGGGGLCDINLAKARWLWCEIRMAAATTAKKMTVWDRVGDLVSV